MQEGVQMHGGMGMTDAFDIGFFMKRARVCQELFGDSNHPAEQLAQLKGHRGERPVAGAGGTSPSPRLGRARPGHPRL
ncbi:MAG: hypothetical protein MZV49_20455 [Rhodopseudomonas palustris]|nr:hypothetical protein [Rhodopseudomonas palustris]